MSDNLLEGYRHWLTSQLYDAEMTRTYTDLAHTLHEKEFVWQVANDDNRIEDGKELRREFHPPWLTEQPVSVLEVIIGLSRRLSFQAGGSAPGWAWKLLQNLKLDRMHDPLSARQRSRVDDVLEDLIWRNYEKDGQGGFFPLAWPTGDQRKIEIWYQMHQYIEEHDPD